MATPASRKRAARQAYKNVSAGTGEALRSYSPRALIKSELGGTKARAVGRNIARSAASGKLDLRKYKAAVRHSGLTPEEARGAARNLRKQYKKNK